MFDDTTLSRFCSGVGQASPPVIRRDLPTELAGHHPHCRWGVVTVAVQNISPKRAVSVEHIALNISSLTRGTANESKFSRPFRDEVIEVMIKRVVLPISVFGQRRLPPGLSR